MPSRGMAGESKRSWEAFSSSVICATSSCASRRASSRFIIGTFLLSFSKGFSCTFPPKSKNSCWFRTTLLRNPTFFCKTLWRNLEFFAIIECESDFCCEVRELRPVIRAIAFDLDDTLLRDDRTISDETVSVLRRASEAGILILPASGRTYCSMAGFCGTHRVRKPGHLRQRSGNRPAGRNNAA